MRLLLDTHVAIWATNTPERISEEIRGLIEDGENELAVSVVAIWEIAIKQSLGRIDAPPFSGDQAIVEFQAASFDLLDIKPAHAAFVERLPLLHDDPFDRIVLAQAAIENMQFMTYDRHLTRYDTNVLTWS